MWFGETIIDLVWRIMENRGLKQGYSLSLPIFIIGAVVLPRMMNQLHHHHMYQGFHMEINGPQINHLSFADDVIIFSSVTSSSLQLIMKVLSTYQRVSGQLINNKKSHFTIPTNTPQDISLISLKRIVLSLT